MLCRAQSIPTPTHLLGFPIHCRYIAGQLPEVDCIHVVALYISLRQPMYMSRIPSCFSVAYQTHSFPESTLSHHWYANVALPINPSKPLCIVADILHCSLYDHGGDITSTYYDGCNFMFASMYLYIEISNCMIFLL